MFITLINDSRDDNAMARQATRLSAILDAPVNRIGVSSDLEAAGNLVDILDAGLGNLGLVVLNVAPRHGGENKRENGSPFVYFFYKDTLVIATLDGLNLSMVKKFNLVDRVNLVDMGQVLSALGSKSGISEHAQARIRATQFRSLEFIPYLAKWLLADESVPSQPVTLDGVPNPPLSIWWVDAFGNCKTTITPQEVQFSTDKKLPTKFGDLPCYLTLKDVPNGEAALVIGSSGFESKRLIELVVQGGSAATRLGVKSGARVF